MNQFQFGPYQLNFVFQSVSEKDRKDVVRLWMQERIIPDPNEAERRSHELSFTIRNSEGELVGVSTVYIQNFRNPQDPHFFYRMFIRPADRVPKLMTFVTQKNLYCLNDYKMPNKPLGVVIVTENRKLMGPGVIREFKKIGMKLLGKDPRGLDVWHYSFLEGEAR